ncbi:hypothetical protein [Amycolatopsis taiwanensis]|uniref:Uncharacterized protein n=1 Tax=Amycolatopsis taiwanensis TaxID=342230 RepID=A0A9W6RAZ4_9PSEU|nr:hypothetical protein [Amycolatopsis taiwanensis]GLY70645.1 hypothetical protein Atai01_72640 [Amycolatopsis taiwanensis]
MSDAFPDEHAPLNGQTFEVCYRLIAQGIHDETPTSKADPFHIDPIYKKMVDEAMAPLDKWRTYAHDGDPALLPTVAGNGTPWADLANIQIKHLHDLPAEVDSIGESLRWNGKASEGYLAYLKRISSRLQSYGGDTGYVRQAAALLEAAFAVQVAFKKDLLELARGAYDKLEAIHDGRHVDDIGTFCVVIGGLALGELGGAIAAGTTITKHVFGKAVTALASYAFGDPTQKLIMHGDTPQKIMKSFDTALGQIVNGYANAAIHVSQEMDDLLTDLRAASDESSLPPVPSVDTSNTPSFTRELFPR